MGVFPKEPCSARQVLVKQEKLDTKQKRTLDNYLEKHQIVQKIQQGLIWSRLYGGGGIIVMTDQNPSLPLDVSAIKEDSELDFVAADMW